MKIWFVSFEFGIESELGNHKNFAINILNGLTPRFALITPQPHVDGFVSHMINGILVVTFVEAYQYKQPSPYFGDGFAFDRYTRLENSLRYDSHN